MTDLAADKLAQEVEDLSAAVVDVFERCMFTSGGLIGDPNDKNVADGLFAVADSIRYFADTVAACPVKDLVEQICIAIRMNNAG